MRVTVGTIDEFIQCLSLEMKIFDETVRVQQIFLTVNEVKKQVHIKFSAVVQTQNGEYLLQGTQECGVDYFDASRERNGSKQFENLKETIKRYADSRNWQVMPGYIEE